MSKNTMQDGGAVGYLEPQRFDSHCPLGRQFSVNDSGIVDIHGSRHSSRTGLSIPNDFYRAWDSDNENNNHPTVFFHRMNSHPPVASHCPHQMCGMTQLGGRCKIPNYEEMPQTNRNLDDFNIYTPIDEKSMVFNFEPTLKSSEVEMVLPEKQHALPETDAQPTNHKTRENPLYPHWNPSPTPYPPVKWTPVSFKGCCFYTLLSITALTALLLALIALLNGHQNHAKYFELEQKHHQLIANYSNLMEMFHSANRGTVDSVEKLSSQITLIKNQLEMIQSNISGQADSVENVSSRIALITNQVEEFESTVIWQNASVVNMFSRMALLQFRNRLVDFSRCAHRSSSVGIAATNPSYETEPLDLKDYFVMGVQCTTEGGTQALLKYDSNHPNVYKCVCRGQYDNAPNRHCIIHYWYCPLIGLSDRL